MTGQSKVIVYTPNRDLPKHDLNGIIIHCSTLEDFEEKFQLYRASNISIVCTNDGLRLLAPLLDGVYLQRLYILMENVENPQPAVPLENYWNSVIISNEKQLMRQLCTDVMLRHYNKGRQLKQNGDWGLANLCFRDARNALDLAETFI